MAMVWRTVLHVDEYAAAGRDVAVPRFGCRACGTPMGLWGWYERDLRVGTVRRLLIRRQRCGPCQSSHAILPEFVAHSRLDGLEVIGGALEAMVEGGRVARQVAELAGVPYTTVRDWRRRFAARAQLLAVGFSRFCVAVGDLAPRLPGGASRVALGAIRAARRAARRRFTTPVAALWQFANVVVGGHLLTTNTEPPWTAA